MPASASRQWRQNWGHLGSQGYGEQEMMYSVSMTSSMESKPRRLLHAPLRGLPAGPPTFLHPSARALCACLGHR